MDTDALRLFVLAAEFKNISRAGRRLGLAPAVASARLAKLERQIGGDLLHRSTRNVSLSLEGAEFLPFAREILAQEDAARDALGRGDGDVRGTIRFAASSTFAQLYVAPALPDFLDRFPNLNLDLRLSDARFDLIDGAFDLALRNYAIEESGLRARRLAPDRRILCASPTYLDRWGAPETVADLSRRRLIAFGSGPPKPLVGADGAQLGRFPPPDAPARVAIDDGAGARIAAVAGAGVCAASLWSVAEDLRRGTLVRVLPEVVIDDGSAVWLVYPKSNMLTAKVRVLIDFLVEIIGSPPIWERSDQPDHASKP